MEERSGKLRTTMDSLPTQYPSYILGRRRELGASSEAGNGQATGQVFSASQDHGQVVIIWSPPLWVHKVKDDDVKDPGRT